MSSAESQGFHKFCRKFLPFLLIKCSEHNLHFIWDSFCQCCDANNYPVYRRGFFWGWKQTGLHGRELDCKERETGKTKHGFFKLKGD